VTTVTRPCERKARESTLGSGYGAITIFPGGVPFVEKGELSITLGWPVF
jgi:hypothetical protein